MVALATAFVRIAPETATFQKEAEKLLGMAGLSAGKAMGKTAGTGAAETFKTSGKEIVKVGEEHGGETGKKFKEKFIEVISVKELAGKLSEIFTVAAGVEMFKGFIESAREAARYSQLTEAVLKSTGDAAGVTGTQVEELAGKLSVMAGVDKGVVISGENLMLTFTGVKNAVGEGNDIFDQATKTALDMTAAMNHGEITTSSLKNTTIAMGKALNNPIEGFKALRRVGVVFTEDQKKQITTMTKAGDTLGAQKVVLKELQREFGGAAEASADPVKRMGAAWSQFQETVGLKMLPLLNKFLDWLNGSVIGKLFAFGQAMSTGIVPIALRVGRTLVGLVPLLTNLIASFVRFAKTVASEVGPALKVLVGGALVGFALAVLQVIKALTGLFNFMAGGSAAAIALRVTIYAIVAGMLVWKAITLAQAAYLGVLTAAEWAWGIAQKATLYASLIPTIAGLTALKVAQVAGAVWTGIVTAAQWAWNAALDANPIGLVIIGIAALVGALILAWQHSSTFRTVVMAMWEGIQTAAKWAYENVLKPVFAGIMMYVRLGIEVFKIYWQVIKAAWEVIVTAAKIAWEVWLHPIFTGIMTLIHVVIAVFHLYADVVKAVWSVISFAISIAWHGVIQPIWVLIQIWLKLLVISFMGLWIAIKFVWGLIAAGIRLAWTSTIKPTWNLIMAGVHLLEQGFTLFLAGLKITWKQIGSLIKTAWTSVIKPVWDLIIAGVHGLEKIFSLFWLGLKTVWNNISNTIKSVWNSGIKPIFTAISNGVSAVGHAFSVGASAIGTAWSRIKDATKAPVNFVIGTVFNRGIIGLWNKVTSWLHLTGMGIQPLQLLEAGGRVPGGKYNRPTAIVGEGNPSYPEYVIPTDPKYRGRAASLWQAAGGDISMLESGGKIEMLAGGGIFGTIKSLASKVLSVGKDALNLIANPAKVIGGLFSAIPKPSDPGGSTWQSAIAAVPKLIIDKATGFITQVVKTFGSSFGGGATGVVRKARGELGIPYSWGGGGLGGPSYGIAQGANIFGFDCSGLTEYAWGANKIDIGGVTNSQWANSHQIAPGNHPGALLFPSGPSVHVMLASDKPGMVIQAPHTGAFVEEVARSAPMWRWPNAAKMEAGGLIGLGKKFTEGLLSPQIMQALVTSGFGGSGSRKGVFDDGGMAKGWPFHASKPEPVLTGTQWADISKLAAQGSRPSIGPINITGLPEIPSEQQVANGIDRVLTMHGSYWR